MTFEWWVVGIVALAAIVAIGVPVIDNIRAAKGSKGTGGFNF